MEKRRRNYTQLKNSMTLIEFEKFCKKIANQYAYSNSEYSSSYFCRNENITRACFYKILDDAVIKNLVEEETIQKMESKAILNQKNHAANAGTTTKSHYSTLRSKRNQYIISLYSDVEIKILAEDFAESVEETKAEFAKRYKVSNMVIDALLKKAFINVIIDDETCRKIQERSLHSKSNPKAEEFFAQLWNARQENKKSASR